LSAIVLVPAVASGDMHGRQMQSVRAVGMMGMPSMGRVGLMMGGAPMLNGTAFAPMHQPSLPMMQGGGPAAGSGSGVSGTGAARLGSQLSSYGPNIGTNTSNPYSDRTQRTPGQDELAALRGHAGGLAWPLALRYLTRDGEWKEMREHIDAR